jgi:hypothetical protein
MRDLYPRWCWFTSPLARVKDLAMSHRISHIAVVSLSACLIVAPSARGGPVVVEDFEDDTGGFVEAAPGFTLDRRDTGGNPGGYMQLTDLVPNGRGGFADAPSAFRGDLSTYDSVQWDLFRSEGTLVPSTLLLTGPGGEFMFEDDGTQTGAWVNHRAPLQDASAWTRILGDGTFAQSRADVTRLGFLLEVSDGIGTEAGLDNVRLAPALNGTVIPLPAALPATLVALGPVIVGAALRRWRRGR